MRFAAGLAGVLLGAAAASADVVVLTTGGRLEGIVRREGDRVLLETLAGNMAFPAASVAEIDEKHVARLEEYYARKSVVDGGTDPRAFLDLAGWARDNGASRFIRPNAARGVQLGLALTDADKVLALAEHARALGLNDEAGPLWKRVLALNPDNETARRALGHRRLGDHWLSEEEFQTAQGNIEFEGRWLSPEERDLLLTERTAELRNRIQEIAERERKVQAAELRLAEETRAVEAARREVEQQQAAVAGRESAVALREKEFAGYRRCTACGLYSRGEHHCPAVWQLCGHCQNLVRGAHACGPR